MKVRDTRSHAHSSLEDEGNQRKQKVENKGQDDLQVSKSKRAKSENGDNGKSAEEIEAEFEEFCKTSIDRLSIDDMRNILDANEVDSSGTDDVVVRRCQDMLFYGVLEKCPLCNGTLDCFGSACKCSGNYSEWSTCTYSTREPTRKERAIKLPKGIQDHMVVDWVKNWKPENRPRRPLFPMDKPFYGMMISLSGRLTKTHQYWREQIEKHGGKVSNSVIGVTCLVVSPAERERGGSSKVAEATEGNIPVVSEAWLIDSIEKKETQPLDAYDVVSDIVVDGRGIPWDKLDPMEEAVESLNAELKLTGKRGVYKDSQQEKEGGYVFEKDGIVYSCAFSLCDQGSRKNEYCILQLIMVPENRLHLYYKKGHVGDDARAEERLEEFPKMGDAIKEFVRLFTVITGNEFEPWEREKKFVKRPHKFYPLDMGDGVDVRSGGLALRQLGAAAAHSKLDPFVANFMKVLCSQEIYRYALMEMGHDSPDLPLGMLSDFHLKKCEELLLNFVENLGVKFESEERENAVWMDFSNKWFTLMHSSRPFKISGPQELADHVAAVLESVRDITVASHLIGDTTDSTLDDPLMDRYKKLKCSITALDKESEDYRTIVKYLEKTYEPIKVGDVSYDVSVENIFMIESSAGPSYEDIKILPNKLLLWCGTRSSNLLRHLHKGFLPAISYVPASGYMFGKAIVCSDAAAEAARYGFTAVDRPEGFLVLAVFAQGEEIIEMSSVPEDTTRLEEKKVCIKGLGRKKTDESEHFVWKDDIKVPCGSIVPSAKKDSLLEYNEYAVYDPKQVCIRFLVGVKYEEKDVVMVSVDPTLDEA